jgi:hypothetical protein
MLVYATAASYAAWTSGAAPANIAGLLRTASMAVAEATELCFYAVDGTGMPVDAKILQAFSDATCCQAASLAYIGYNPLSGGVADPSVATSKAIGSARLTFADAKQLAVDKHESVVGLCLDARRILQAANLVPSTPWVV